MTQDGNRIMVDLLVVACSFVSFVDTVLPCWDDLCAVGLAYQKRRKKPSHAMGHDLAALLANAAAVFCFGSRYVFCLESTYFWKLRG